MKKLKLILKKRPLVCLTANNIYTAEILDNICDIILVGDSLSVIDVAWVIYINRLVFCGYPLERLHPNVTKWFWPLRQKEEFDSELAVSPALQELVNQSHRRQEETSSTLIDVANL